MYIFEIYNRIYVLMYLFTDVFVFKIFYMCIDFILYYYVSRIDCKEQIKNLKKYESTM